MFKNFLKAVAKYNKYVSLLVPIAFLVFILLTPARAILEFPIICIPLFALVLIGSMSSFLKYSAISNIKNDDDILDTTLPHRFKKVFKDPDRYFTPRDYKKYKISYMIFVVFFAIVFLLISFTPNLLDYIDGASTMYEDSKGYYVYQTRPDEEVRMYWKDKQGKIFKSFENVKSHIEQNGQEVSFITNGGIYMEANVPLGLYIENGETLASLNQVKRAFGNFYIQPNGVFVIHKNGFEIVPTGNFTNSDSIVYANQSGPMLLIEGDINPLFNRDSQNKRIRSSVCTKTSKEEIAPQVVFTLSEQAVTFYEFSKFLKKRVGCKNALYLDGTISKIYSPLHDEEYFEGDFAVIIGVTKSSNN